MSRSIVGLVGKTISEPAFVRAAEQDSQVIAAMTVLAASRDAMLRRASVVLVEVDAPQAPPIVALRAQSPSARYIAAITGAARPQFESLSREGFASWGRVAGPSDVRALIASSASPATNTTGIAPRSGRVLVVEDDPALRSLAEQLLEDAGHEVHLAESGHKAMEIMKTYRPDVVLLDIMMPGMDGREVCRWLRSRPETADVPVLFVSAIDALTEKLRAFEAGGNDFVCKPYDEQELLRKVANLLDVVNTRKVLGAKRQ